MSDALQLCHSGVKLEHGDGEGPIWSTKTTNATIMSGNLIVVI